MALLQPPPTYAEVILLNEQTKQGSFNPIWLKWFLELAQSINASGGLAGIGGSGTVNTLLKFVPGGAGNSSITDDGTTATVGSVLKLPAGTVSLPSLYLSTDTTTGFYRNAANEISVAISGARTGVFSSIGLKLTRTNSSPTTILPVLNLERLTSGIAANGMGVRYAMKLQDDFGDIYNALRVDALWANLVNTNSRADFYVTGNGGAAQIGISLLGTSLGYAYAGFGTTTPSNFMSLVFANISGGENYFSIDDTTTGASIRMGVKNDGSANKYPGIWFNQTSPSFGNYSFLGQANDIIFNAQSGGIIQYRIENNSRAVLGDLGFGIFLAANTAPTRPFEVKQTSGGTTAFIVEANGNVGVGSATPTARFHLPAGTATANTTPLKFNSGTLLTIAEVGAIEFLTDDYYATITTGAARKKFVLDDGTALTSGRVPFATTNGRLTDDADMTFATDTLTVTKLSALTSVLSPSIISTGIVRLKNYTVATLPAGTQGDTAFVTDATAPTYLGTLTGGGAVVTPVFYNGTAWVSY